MKVTFLILLTLVTTPAFSEFVFVAAPRGTREEETKIYQPIADYMSQITGTKIRYKYVRSWGEYRGMIRDDGSDFYFDGAQFNSFRHEYKGGQFIARFPGPIKFEFIVKSDNNKITKISDTNGRPVCLHQEPNLATLQLFKHFIGGKTPMPVTIEGWDNAYRGVIKGDHNARILEAGTCVATVVPAGIRKKHDTTGATKVIYAFDPLPNNALMANKYIQPDLVAKLREALTSGQCKACANLFTTYNVKEFVLVDEKDYLGVSNVLVNDFWLGKDIKAKVAVNQ